MNLVGGGGGSKEILKKSCNNRNDLTNALVKALNFLLHAQEEGERERKIENRIKELESSISK